MLIGCFGHMQERATKFARLVASTSARFAFSTAAARNLTARDNCYDILRALCMFFLLVLCFRREVHLRGAVSTRVSTECCMGLFVSVSGVRLPSERNLQTRGTPSRSPAKDFDLINRHSGSIPLRNFTYGRV